MTSPGRLVAAALVGAALWAGCDNFEPEVAAALCRADAGPCPDAGQGGGAGGGGAVGGGAGGGVGGGVGGGAGDAGADAGSDAGLDAGVPPLRDGGTLTNGPFLPTEVVFRNTGQATFGGAVQPWGTGVVWAWYDNRVSVLQPLEGLLPDGGGFTARVPFLPVALATQGDFILTGGPNATDQIAGIADGGAVATWSWLASQEAPRVAALFSDGGTTMALVVTTQVSGPAYVHTFDTAAIAAPVTNLINSTALCTGPSPTVRDSEVDPTTGAVYVVFEGCQADSGTSTELYRLSPTMLPTRLGTLGPFAAVGVSETGQLWVAYRSGSDAVLERRDSTTLVQQGTPLIVTGLSVSDVVPTPGGTYAIGSTSGTQVTYDGGELAPQFVYQTLIIEFDASGALLAFGRLDTDSNWPASNGSRWAHGKLWVSGSCTNDGGFCDDRDGGRQAFLMAITP